MFSVKKFALAGLLLLCTACTVSNSSLEPAVVGSDPAGQQLALQSEPTLITPLPTATLYHTPLVPPAVGVTAEATATALPTSSPLPVSTPAVLNQNPPLVASTVSSTGWLGCGSVTEIPVAECVALEGFYTKTDGPNWYLGSNWFQSASPCQWEGIRCANGQIVGISLARKHLKGSIPTEIGQFLALQTLSLTGNNGLNGSIPMEIGDLSQLKELNLADNDLRGTIPSVLGNLSQLTLLNFSCNELTGEIPTELSQLTQLEKLFLNCNYFTGTIPTWLGDLAHLQELALSGNQFTGSIPAELGNLSQLKSLLLEGLQLSGSIPATLSQLTQLQHLSLTANQLTGQLPVELTQLTQLKTLSLAQNPELNGALPIGFTTISLGSFSYDGTNVCSPNTPEFQNWLASIPFLSGNGQLCP